MENDIFEVGNNIYIEAIGNCGNGLSYPVEESSFSKDCEELYIINKLF